MTNSKYNSHTDPLFKQLYILKVNDIFKLNALKFYFKFTTGELPTYFHNMFIRIEETHNYTTRGRFELTQPNVTTSVGKKCIRYYMSNILINTQPSIKSKINTHSLEGFIAYYKNITINNYADHYNNPNCFVCN